MNQGMVDRWNSIVKPEDEVFVFGDFSLGYDGAAWRKKLNGTVYLIPGNHDKCHQVFHKNREVKMRNVAYRYKELGFILLPENGYLELTNGTGVIKAQYSHFPFQEDHGNFEKTPRYQELRAKPDTAYDVLLHGHVHNTWKVKNFTDPESKKIIPQVNLGVDVWDWFPVSEQELFNFCKKQLDLIATQGDT
jgi:calcineurin-like phosphoesterase family protein